MRKSQAVLLLESQNEIVLLKQKVEDLEKKLESQKSNAEYQSKEKRALEEELEQFNLLIDALPNSPGRQTESENSWEKKKLSALTRLAVFFASKT